jgi:hypothetical protein
MDAPDARPVGDEEVKGARSPDAREFLTGDRHKHRRLGRLLAVFKGLVMLALLALTAYGMMRNGLYLDELWLPVAAGVLALLFATLFARGFYADLPPVGILALAFLAALVAVKGLSMVWTISETETIKETLRSSMYLAIFVMALGALTSARQVGPLVDISVLIVVSVAGYGLLQKINPIDYPVQSIDGVRVDSTLGYSNTTAVIIAMGVVLALARMATLRNFAFRGLYAALTLCFLTSLYLTVSRGGIGSLAMGVILLFVLGSNRLQMLANLALVALPGAWLWWRMQGLPGLLETGIRPQEKLADGTAFRNDLIFALLVAFALQLRRIGRYGQQTHLAGHQLEGRLLEGRLEGLEGAPLYRHRGGHVPVHVAGRQTLTQRRQTGPQPLPRTGHGDRHLRLRRPDRLRGHPCWLHGEGRLELGRRTTTAPLRTPLRPGRVPDLLRRRMALVYTSFDDVFLYPSRHRHKVRLQGRLGRHGGRCPAVERRVAAGLRPLAR